jgi:hypothetical protein
MGLGFAGRAGKESDAQAAVRGGVNEFLCQRDENGRIGIPVTCVQ